MATGSHPVTTFKQKILNALSMFWGKLKTTYVTSTASNAGNNLALAASAGYNLQQQINTLNSKFIYDNNFQLTGTGYNYLYVPQSTHSGYELISATNANWDLNSRQLISVAHQGTNFVLFFDAGVGVNTTINVNLLWIKR